MSEDIILRPYQEAAIVASEHGLQEGVVKQIWSLATGTGKTMGGTTYARHRGVPTLWLVHRDELVRQAAEAFSKSWSGASIGIVKAAEDDYKAPVVVASVQSLSAKRLNRWNPDRFGTVIVDECHHAPAISYRKILDFLHPQLLLGLTATPFRTDKQSLEGTFDRIVYSYGIQDGIRDGYLVDIRAFRVEGKADLDAVHTMAGDFNAGELSHALNTPARNRLIVEAYQKHAQGTKTIAFTAGVRHAYDLAEMFRTAGVPAEAIDGTIPPNERRAVLGRLKTGETRVVANAAVLCLDAETEILTSEGFVGMESMTFQHQVANWDQGTITFQHPLDIVQRPRASWERMVMLETPRRSIRVTEGHRMLYRTATVGDFLKVPARNLIGRSIQLPLSGQADPFCAEPEQPVPPTVEQRRRLIQSASYHLRKREGYDFAGSVQEASRRHEIRYNLRRKNPCDLTLSECQFIGYWLGDGSVVHLRSGGVEYRLIESTHNQFIATWIDSIVENMGVDFIKRYQAKAAGTYSYTHWAWSFPRGTGFGSQARQGLYAIEPYLNKLGTPLLWGLSESQFAALIEGLWMADGRHGDGRTLPQTYVIEKTHLPLLSQLQAIAVCRGYRATLRPVRYTKTGWAPRYTLSMERESLHRINNRETRYTFQFEKEWKPERVWCVRTQSGNIITRRQGTVTVMGNSEGFDEPTIGTVIMARPTKSLGLFTQMTGRGTRPASGKTHMILLDIADNTRRHRIISVKDLMGLRRDPESGSSVAARMDREGRISEDGERWLGRLNLYSEQVINLFEDLVESDTPILDFRDILAELSEIHEDPDLLMSHLKQAYHQMSAPDDPASNAQIKRLQDFGWADAAQRLTKWEASYALDRHKTIMASWASERATQWAHLMGWDAAETQRTIADALWHLTPASDKQRSLLHRLHTPDELIAGLTKGEASRLIDTMITAKSVGKAAHRG